MDQRTYSTSGGKNSEKGTVKTMALITEPPERRAFQLLISKYQADPSWFEQSLPDIAEIIRQAVPPSQLSQPPFVLTECEREFHINALPDSEAMSKLSHEDAIETLEHCASLILDDYMTDCGSHKARISMVEAAIGQSPESFEKDTTISISDTPNDSKPSYHVPIIRGVVMNLDSDMRLMSIAITPDRVHQYRSLMSIVGIGRDTKSDVAMNHDYYLDEIYGDFG